MDFLYKKSGTIFNAHSYWTKQPVDVICDFINKYSDKGDTVMDPFCGSGMTGVACIKTGRNFILSDISPICLHIADGYCTPLPGNLDIDSLLKELTENIEYLYTLTCPECGEKCFIDYTILEDKLEKEQKLEIQHIVFHCHKCKKKIKKVPDQNDIFLQNTCAYKDCFYPQAYFFGEEPKRNYKRQIHQVFQLYSPRNLSALCLLRENIIKIKDAHIRQFCLFCFTSIVFNCSIMSRYNPKYENTQIKMGTFYIPPFIKDNNVVSSFARKLKNIYNANKEIFSEKYDCNGIVQYANATNLNNVASQSVDYIYTDPPYSDKINYSELNIVYESWLGKECTDSSQEMVVSKKGKTIKQYSDMFLSFLNEAYRVLKQDKKITIIFHNSSLEHWKYFQSVLNKSPFVPTKPYEIERLISSSKTATQYQTENNSQCFLAFTLEKSKALKEPLIDLNKEEYLSLINSLRSDATKKGYTTKSDQFDYIVNSLLFKYIIHDDINI